jgi:dTDP-4-amino-4,6-dideoxygalactose transaminase
VSVPFLDLAQATSELSTEIDGAIHRVLASGWYVLGPEVDAFETEFAESVGAGACVGVGNGLDALTLGLLALGVSPGDEVIVPANTYIATWLAVTHAGGRIVPVEPDPRTFNLDPDRIEAAITDRTRVILPVHLYGQPADMPAIRSVADQHGIRVLEDCAQAHGARAAGSPMGALGDLAAWSFYPTKNLGALGDAGAVTAHDPDLAARVRLLRNYGSRAKYVNEEVGVNSRLDELQASVLRVKLRHLSDWNERRRLLARRYLDAIDPSADTAVGRTCLAPVRCPVAPAGRPSGGARDGGHRDDDPLPDTTAPPGCVYVARVPARLLPHLRADP